MQHRFHVNRFNTRVSTPSNGPLLPIDRTRAGCNGQPVRTRACLTDAERAALVRELRADEQLMRDMMAAGYRQPEFRALISGWTDRMARAAAALDGHGEVGDDARPRLGSPR